MRRISLLYFFVFFLLLTAYGQNEFSHLPYSYLFKLSPIKQFNTMPAIQANLLKSEDIRNATLGLKRKRFAKDFTTDLHPYNSGIWETAPNGGMVWRLGIRSVSAYSIYLVFGRFHLEKGVRLFVYNKNYADMFGPISFLNNNPNKVYPIAPLPGDEIIVEMNVDPGIKNFGELTLTRIWHDYINEFGVTRKKSTEAAFAGECEVDINCPEGENWQKEKNAVCKLIVNGELCTGTLINNVRGETIPYLITAYHCIEDSSIAASSIIIFNHERPYCNADFENINKYMGGATLVATTPNELDFSLIRLYQFPSLFYRAYLAGWETDPINPNGYKITGATCIHHPQGDVKKISYDKDLLETGDFGEGFLPQSHWVVKKWEFGATEGGSSGAPLFNNNHRLIGTLTGGDAACGNPVNDYFTKFLLSWDYFADSAKQLRTWLDPDNTGATFVNGIDPYGFNNQNCDTISNIRENELLTLAKSSIAGGYLSGNNDQKWKHFAEKFHTADTTELAEVIFNVAKSYAGDYLSYFMLNIWNGDEMPDSLLYSKPVFIKSLKPGSMNFIRLDSLLVLKGNFFIGYSVNYTIPADTFALYFASKRIAIDTSTMYIKKTDNWYNLKDLTGINYPTSLDIKYIACNNLNRKLYTPALKENLVKLYPNPCESLLVAEIKNAHLLTSLTCYNIQGRAISVDYNIDHNTIYINTSKLKPGIYWLSAIFKNQKYTGKFMVVR